MNCPSLSTSTTFPIATPRTHTTALSSSPLIPRQSRDCQHRGGLAARRCPVMEPVEVVNSLLLDCQRARGREMVRRPDDHQRIHRLLNLQRRQRDPSNNQAVETPHLAPARWGETYDVINEMRSRFPAPVYDGLQRGRDESSFAPPVYHWLESEFNPSVASGTPTASLKFEIHFRFRSSHRCVNANNAYYSLTF